MRFFKFFLLFSFISFSQSSDGFIDIKEYIPSIIIDLKYATDDNFTGRVVKGYESPKCLLTFEAARSLKIIQTILNNSGYSLKIYDAYRPQRSVNHFINWSKNQSDTLKKSYFYPNILKSNLFDLGYIATNSSHSRGSTVDITIVILAVLQMPWLKLRNYILIIISLLQMEETELKITFQKWL